MFRFSAGDKIVRTCSRSNCFGCVSGKIYTFKTYVDSYETIEIEELHGTWFSSLFILEKLYNTTLYQALQEDDDDL